MKYRFYILFLFLFSKTSFSQSFFGGNADGFTIKSFQTQNNPPNIFNGGNADGFALKSFETQINSSNIFNGGNADGFALKTLETQINSPNLFNGGNADGFALKSFETQINSPNIFNGGNADGFVLKTLETQINSPDIFSGGNADGFALKTLETQINSPNIYNGGNADGFAIKTLETQISLPSMFKGGNADGFALKALETQINSPNIFAGGNADGFSFILYDENPNCSDDVTQWTQSSWTNGVPNNTTQIVINNLYFTQFYGNLNACSCLVKNDGVIVIQPNTYVKLEEDLINNGTIDILNQGSFVQVNNDATVTGSGYFNTRIETTPLVDQHRFTYFSSPVQSQNLEVFNSWANMNRLWRFDESVQDWYQVPSTTNMTPAIGFAIQGAPDTGQYPFTGQVVFSGAYNNGIYSYPLTYNVGGIDDDNALVGNPYPSAIDAALLLSTNAEANAFYFWTHDSELLAGGYAGDDYAIWNSSGGVASGSGSAAPTGYIASGQGFFVDAVGTGNLVFNNAMRVTDHNDDFRTPENETRDRIWLNLTNEDGLFNQILINFTEDATIDFDAKLDATRFNTGNPISFYTNGNHQERFAIQALPNLTNETIVPLGFDVVEETITHLKISTDHINFQSEFAYYLRDNLLHVTHDLQQSDYEFDVSLGEVNDRFELIFNRNALGTSETILNNDNLIVSNYSDTEIIVKTKNGVSISDFKAFDVLGKLIIDLKPNQSSFIINTNINQGTVLFIKVKLDNNQVLNKKFIKL